MEMLHWFFITQDYLWNEYTLMYCSRSVSVFKCCNYVKSYLIRYYYGEFYCYQIKFIAITDNYKNIIDPFKMFNFIGNTCRPLF